MARIRTYDAPIDRIRPDDRGYAAQETAARRISFKTSEQAQNLREGGRLEAQNIRAQFNADQEIAALRAGPQTRSAGGGGGGGSAGGGGGSRSASPREAAQMAAGLTRAVAGPPPIPDGPGAMGHYVTQPRVPMGPYDPLYNTPIGMGGAGYRLPEGPTLAGQDNLPYPPESERRVMHNPVDFYENTPGAYDYETSANPVATTATRLAGFFQEYGGAIVSGLSAAYQAATTMATEPDNPYNGPW